MKFIDEFDIELVNQALQFETSDCRIQGGCDLFSTRPANSDKKLYKTIDNHLNALLQESANITVNPPKQNPFYPRSYSSTYYVSAKPLRSGSIGSFTETKRRNSDVPITRLELQGESGSTSVKDQTASNNSQLKKDSFVEPLPVKRTRRRSSKKIDKDVESSLITSGISQPINMPTAKQNRSGSEVTSEDPITPQTKVYDLINQSPFGPLSSSGSRKTFASLIGVLNSTYPDHDFTLLEPSDFVRVTPVELIDKFNNTLISLGKLPMEWIWDTLSTHIELDKCSVYFYAPSESFLEDEPGSLWSMMWFIINKRKKRLAYLYLNAIKRSVPFRNTYYIGAGGKRRQSITIDDSDEESFDEANYSDDFDYTEEALMSDIDEEYN